MNDEILLVAPPLTFEPAYPLRLAALATALERAGYHPVGIDLRADPTALDRHSGPRPRLVVVDSSIRNLTAVAAVTARVRAQLRCPVVITGAPAALEPARLLAAPFRANAAVTGDPELVVPALLAAGIDGDDAIAGCHRRTSSGTVRSATGGFLTADRLPPAHRGVFPGGVAAHPLRRGVRLAAVEASRGCSLTCSFCPVPRWSQAQLRCRPVAAVIDELERLRRDHGATSFLIEDDQPLLDRAWWTALLGAFRRQLAPTGASLELPNGLRPDLLDEELLAEMAGSGVTRLALGIESGSARVRASLARAIDDDELLRVITAARRQGLVVTGYFMLGLPGERRPERWATIRAARTLPLHYVHLSVCWPWRTVQLRASREMERLARLRALAYLTSYGEPRRLGSLVGLGDLTLGGVGASARRLRRWLGAGALGGGGW